ncbi:hypothetical protein ACIBCO_05850 [Streptomyces violascens]|uniref:hypothetical protein n=1 Tax=Streptomyces violascens TaxID=67381 RepID=UPI0037997E0D
MADPRLTPNGDTPTSDDCTFPVDLLAQRLTMLSGFVEQACTTFERQPTQSRRMLLTFTAVLGSLTQDLQAILTPGLNQRATDAIGRLSASRHTGVSDGDRASAARLLAGIWGTGASEGVTADTWWYAAPGPATSCLQVAVLTGQYAQWNHQRPVTEAPHGPAFVADPAQPNRPIRAAVTNAPNAAGVVMKAAPSGSLESRIAMREG